MLYSMKNQYTKKNLKSIDRFLKKIRILEIGIQLDKQTNKMDMGMAGSFFEPRSYNFGELEIF